MKRMALQFFWTWALLLLVRTSCDAPAPWTSVSEPMKEQVSQVVEWADEARKAAGKAGEDALLVKQSASKAGSSMANVMAKVGSAKAAMEQAVSDEGKIARLRNQMWQRAKEVAMGEIPKMLPKLKKELRKEAEKKAKQKAQVFEKQMKKKASVESAKASKVYTDLMVGAGKTAADYAKLGDTLIGQSASMQMNAGLVQGQAGQYLKIGDMGEAQKLLQQSRSEMNMALGLNAQATGMYNQANQITAQLPAYAGQAGVAAYHAQVMYDPAAQPPPPPLVLTQQREQLRVERSFLSQGHRTGRK